MNTCTDFTHTPDSPRLLAAKDAISRFTAQNGPDSLSDKELAELLQDTFIDYHNRSPLSADNLALAKSLLSYSGPKPSTLAYLKERFAFTNRNATRSISEILLTPKNPIFAPVYRFLDLTNQIESRHQINLYCPTHNIFKDSYTEDVNSAEVQSLEISFFATLYGGLNGSGSQTLYFSALSSLLSSAPSFNLNLRFIEHEVNGPSDTFALLVHFSSTEK